MLFSSISFIYYFLPVVLLVYFVIPFKLKNYWLLLTSLFFYFWGEPGYTALMLFTIGSSYAFGFLIGNKREKTGKRRLLILSLTLCLALLGFFKYADFLIGVINGVTGLALPLLRIPLPLGISFYTFQIMSYTIDVYRGAAEVQRNPFKFAAYVSLFPQLVAGPIVRYQTVEHELNARRHSITDFAAGAGHFVIGLSKKVLIANQLGEFYNAAISPAENSVALSWLSVIAFSLQVYFDFSGYSDMAIGMGRIFGFHFLENFNYPFTSRSISEFWRRWHISLGTWFREYLYIPLGGNRALGGNQALGGNCISKLKWLRNLFAVWLCTGLWHGASWNFVLWGLYFGIFLSLEKLVLQQYLDTWPTAFRRLYALLFVTLSFVIFHNETLTAAAAQFSNMFGLGGLPVLGAETVYVLKSFAVLTSLAVIGSTPMPKKLGVWLRGRFTRLAAVSEPVFYACLLLLCTAYLVDSSFNPFLYFRF